jgi:hypothetical protein
MPGPVTGSCPRPARRQALIQEIRRVPDDWKPVAFEHVRMVAKLTNRPPVRIIGDDDLPPEPEELA